MAMSAAELEAYLVKAFPDAQIKIDDLAGDGDHYSCSIVSEAFRDVPRVRQHQLVYSALEGHMGEKLHALALHTSAP